MSVGIVFQISDRMSADFSDTTRGVQWGIGVYLTIARELPILLADYGKINPIDLSFSPEIGAGRHYSWSL